MPGSRNQKEPLCAHNTVNQDHSSRGPSAGGSFASGCRNNSASGDDPQRLAVVLGSLSKDCSCEGLFPAPWRNDLSRGALR